MHCHLSEQSIVTVASCSLPSGSNRGSIVSPSLGHPSIVLALNPGFPSGFCLTAFSPKRDKIRNGKPGFKASIVPGIFSA